MSMIFIIYPHQLFEDITNLEGKKILLIEEPLFFTQYLFHKQKLVLHRASMKYYESYLKSNYLDVEYFEDESYLIKYKNSDVSFYDVCDYNLSKKIYNNFNNITQLENPNFLNTDDCDLFLNRYYIRRRKELSLFINKDGKPYGEKWSMDSSNRLKLPKETILPATLVFENEYINKAKIYIDKFESIGEINECYYPTNHSEAKQMLDYFLYYKFNNFGGYQDAMHNQEIFLFHSNISSSLNIGLLSLANVIDAISQYDAPYNSKEGFIRQIIGWREFMFSVYRHYGIKLRNSNFFDCQNKIPSKIRNCQTTLVPVDDVLNKLHSTAYSHHIERLMILGNIFLLLEIHPDNVYEFFMENYIDSYDWVMVGNVYGMSGFCDGGGIATKPYICSSNYILKMSHYKKGDWCNAWDALYWRFVNKYRDKLSQNIRMRMQYALLDKMDKHKLQNHLDLAESFLLSIHR